MAFGRKIHHRAGLVGSQQAGQQRTVAKVALYEHMAGVPGQGGEVLQIAGVGQFVEVDNRFIRLG